MYVLQMEITNHDRVSHPDFAQHREERAPRATHPTRSEAVLPVSPAGNRGSPGVAGVFLITSADGVVIQEIIEALNELSESEGET